MTPFLTESNGVVLVRVYLQPRASKSRVLGLHGDELKVAVTAPPVDNAANEMVVRLLADLVSVPRSAVSVKSGRASRHKTIAISGKTAAEVAAALA